MPAGVKDVGAVEKLFLIQRKLGHGGYGDVFLVKKKKDKAKKLYALKIFNDVPLVDVKAEYDIVRGLLSELGHPKLARYYDVFTGTYKKKKANFVLMEFVKGYDMGDLIDCISQKRYIPTAEEVGLFMSDLIKTVGYLHSHDIAHLDIKTNNIIFTEDKLVLVDYGTLCNVKDMTNKPCLYIGTAAYMSPEMTFGYNDIVNFGSSVSSEIFFASDIWSLGILFTEVATAVDIYESKFMFPDQAVRKIKKKNITYNQALAQLKKIMKKPPKTDKPKGKLQKIINSMLTLDYRKRPTAADILQRL